MLHKFLIAQDQKHKPAASKDTGKKEYLPHTS
jgi:hypothetical protein